MFIQIIQGRCSRPDEMRAALDRWRAECEPGAEGFLGGTYGMTDDGMFVGVVRFENEELAMRNSGRPEQSRWWAETEHLFDGPVEFHNARDVTLLMEGGSDDAGFVQIIQGRVQDPARLKTMLQSDTETLHEMRPDIIGGTLAIEDDGTFTETIAFTSEAAAREGEAKPMPEDVGREWGELMANATYMDLHHPWFATHR